ncbi:MAG: hypothetical protein KDB22_29280 [Planctomycetales bacterium]|nr:hypothetical protein [Planctomycetales bacterium]
MFPRPVGACSPTLAQAGAYGVNAVAIEQLSEFDEKRFDYLVISINHLYGIACTDVPVSSSFSVLQDMEPVDRVSDSILVFSASQVQDAQSKSGR